MGFDHNKNKHAGQDSMWTSYSDLFLGLSIIFLLLYVTSSLKTGTDGIRQALENKVLAKESADLKQQIKVYETLKQNYMQKEASQDEQANYQELMSKLDLLQDEQKDEESKLKLKAQDNAKKAVALNKYQQMIRNIINTNVVAKSRIKNRDTMIDQKEEVIEEKTEEITSLEGTVAQKSAAIKKNEAQIEEQKEQLDERMKQLKNAYTAHKMSKQKYEQQQAQLKKDSESRLQALAASQAKTKQELDAAARELQATNSKLGEVETKAAQLGQAKDRLEGELASAEGKHKADLDRAKGEFAAQQARDKAAFDGQLAKEKLSGAERAAREGKFKADAERKAGELAGKMADLDKKFKATQGELAKANENLNARKKLANQIKSNFGKYGVKADVDEGTGDVLLSFGDEYFGSGQSDLKPKMRKILEQAMPVYSASLFENEKVANKIQSVEIVGFASPTYKGKYVDPTSLAQKDREAVNYNLDLSYGRARSIFNYVFDKEKLAFKHQQRLLPLVKVTGRSFLTSDKQRDPATTGNGSEGFCKVNDCAKLQKVIIKFTLKD